MELVKPDDPVDLVIEKYPKSVKFFSEKNIVCVQCGEPVWGNVNDIISKKYDNTKQIIDELNDYLKANK